MSGRRGAAVLFAVASGAYLFDRLTKIWVEHTLAGRPPIHVLPGVDLRFTTNSGGAFSIGERAPWLFVAATLGVSIAIVVSSFRHRRLSHAIALGLVLGGALGNLTDRIVRGPGFNGRVVDFVDVHIWPIFNAADAAIVVGAIVLGWSAMRHREGGDAA